MTLLLLHSQVPPNARDQSSMRLCSILIALETSGLRAAGAARSPGAGIRLAEQVLCYTCRGEDMVARGLELTAQMGQVDID
jgi:hypothetical protein